MNITKDYLEKLYREKSNIEVCGILGISNATLVKLVKDSGIELKGKGNREPKSKITVIE